MPERIWFKFSVVNIATPTSPGSATATVVSANRSGALSSLVSIDILRGISAVGVVLFHSRVDLWVGFREIQANPQHFTSIDRCFAWLSAPISQLGYLVMLFFVISGFCIHLPYAGSLEAPSWRIYAIRRIFRIVPPYLVALILSLYVIDVSDDWRRVSSEQGSLVLWSAVFMQNYIAGGQLISNPSLWSIPVEVELYFVYVLIAVASRRFSVTATSVFFLTGLCSAVAAGLYALGWIIFAVNFLKFWVIWWSGAWLAEKWRAGSLPSWRWSGWLCLIVALLSTACMTWAKVPYAYLHFGWGAISFCALWWCLVQQWEPKTWIWRIFGRVGLFSYSLYLVHFPVLRLMGIWWCQTFGGKSDSILVSIVGALVCVPIAWIFYMLIERPFHLLGRSIGRRFSRPSVS